MNKNRFGEGYLSETGYIAEEVQLSNQNILCPTANSKFNYIISKICTGSPVIMGINGDNHAVNVIGYSYDENEDKYYVYYNDPKKSTTYIERNFNDFSRLYVVTFSNDNIE